MDELTIREANREDLVQLLELYTQLNDNVMPEIDLMLEGVWDGMLADKDHHIVVGVLCDRIDMCHHHNP